MQTNEINYVRLFNFHKFSNELSHNGKIKKKWEKKNKNKKNLCRYLMISYEIGPRLMLFLYQPE